MATGKKSFIAYSDWKDVFDELPNEDAGALIKHIFAYVNDENPTTDSVLIKAVFANIKSTLKRDLNKWESQMEQRSLAGKRSAELRALNKTNEIKQKSTVVDSRVRNPTDNVNVSVSVNDNVNVNDILLKKETKEIKIGKSLNSVSKKEPIEIRKQKFKDEVRPFLEKYGLPLIESFYNYWSELTMDRNKMRFEIQKTWETNLRLATWAKNDKTFNQKSNGITIEPKLTASERLEKRKQDFNRKLDEAIKNSEH